MSQMNGNVIHLMMLKRELFQDINKDMKIKEIMKEILFVIIYGTKEQKYQKIGKMNNIRTLNSKKLKMEQIILWHSYKHMMKEKYQINNIIMILILLVVVGLQLWLLLKIILFLLSNGIINLIFRIIMVIQLQC